MPNATTLVELLFHNLLFLYSYLYHISYIYEEQPESVFKSMSQAMQSFCLTSVLTELEVHFFRDLKRYCDIVVPFPPDPGRVGELRMGIWGTQKYMWRKKRSNY